jgi:hypothetical protein
MFRRIPLIRLNKRHHLIIPYQPSSLLIHISYINLQTSDFLRHFSSCVIVFLRNRMGRLFYPPLSFPI